jgi:hypothetical protein
MPLKVTIAYGRNFHFFRESHENNFVYLEMEDVPFEVGYRRVMIAIPIDVWETLRGLAAVDLTLVNLPDAELITLVGNRVNERIAAYENIRASSPEKADAVRFNDSTMFGLADEAHEEQVARGIQYYKLERERQRSIVSRMAQHKIIEIGTEAVEDES